MNLYYGAHPSGTEGSSTGPQGWHLPQSSCCTAGFSPQAAAPARGCSSSLRLLLWGLSIGCGLLQTTSSAATRAPPCLQVEICPVWYPWAAEGNLLLHGPFLLQGASSLALLLLCAWRTSYTPCALTLVKRGRILIFSTPSFPEATLLYLVLI